MTLFIIAMSILPISKVFAQGDSLSVEGIVLTKKGQISLPGATILLINIKDSTKSKYSSTATDGSFQIQELEQAFYKLRVSSIGYKSFQKLIRIQLKENKLGAIYLEDDAVSLEEVTVEGQIAAVQQRGDTTEYNASSFKTNVDATSADLVKKMPGIQVTSDGVSANGENIEQVLLDGKRFFGQDPLLSLNTISAEVVDKVMVYDEQSEQSRLTGFDDGNTTKTMNLITKSGKKNGQFGKVYAGIGENERYKAGLSLNAFNGDRRVTLLGMSNNINLQNFGQEDLAGISGGGGRGGFRRGGNNTFITGEQSGITSTNSAGINFTDQLSKKLSMEGSYFFNATKNQTQQESVRETFQTEESQFYEESNNSSTDNLNHRLNIRLDYDIDDNNKLLFRSSFSLQDNSATESVLGETYRLGEQVENSVNNQFKTDNDAMSISNQLTYQHKFKKIGRTISAELNHQTQPTERAVLFKDIVNNTNTDYVTDVTNQKINPSLTYTEPVGSAGQLAASYQYGYTQQVSNNDVFTVNESRENISKIDELSNEFKSVYTYHRPSLMYSLQKNGSHFAVGAEFQSAELKNTSVSLLNGQTGKTFNSILPSILTRFELNAKTRFFARYSASTTEPTVSQLQNVIINTNPVFVTIGNPDLNQTYTNSLRMGIQFNNTDKNRSFSNFSRVSHSLNYITDQTFVLRSDSLTPSGIVLERGVQLISPVNLDGYWQIQNNSTYSFAIKPIKNNVNLSTNLAYSRIPGLSNNQINYSNSYSAAFKVGLTSNISEKVDYNVYYELNGTKVLNSVQGGAVNQYSTQTIATELSLTFKKDIVFRSDTYFQKYNGASNSFNSIYTLWNLGVAKKFLKNKLGELEFSVFDLLGQNQSFNQTISAQYLEETKTTVLQRYLMLTFTYQIRNFKSL
ncbi:MAG: hypothetical protein ACJAV5_000589 [Vicingaceae bacterium]|jgi:hypothetical protein